MQTAEPHTERCPKCSGRGTRWRTIDGIRGPYTCGGCKGMGERTYAASAEKRAHTNAVAKARKERKLAEAIDTFKAVYPGVYAWMVSSAFPFAQAMRAAIHKYGGLTEKQLQASLRCVRRET